MHYAIYEDHEQNRSWDGVVIYLHSFEWVTVLS